MHPALSDFLRAVPEWAPAIVRLDRAAVGGDVNARARLAIITWICKQPRSVLEKYEKIVEWNNLPEGFVHLSMYEFTGWGPDGADAARTMQ